MTISLVHNLLIILAAGFVAAIVCRRLNVSVLVGYLIAGAVLGGGVLSAIIDDDHQLEHFTEAGVFLLLFSIGLEFSLDDMRRLGLRQMLGGTVQMSATAFPVAAALSMTGLETPAIVLVSAAVSFSSTVLVFKALAERGQNEQSHGRRSIGLLLFQDAALVPLLLVVPMIAGDENASIGWVEITRLIVVSVSFVAGVFGLRALLAKYVIAWLASYRSADLVILLTMLVLGGVTLAAASLSLPPAVGAFAAGLIFNGNRWTKQIDALVLPFRETFAAVFFVGLGLLFDPAVIVARPVAFAGWLAGLLIVKWIAAAAALRVTGLDWRRSVGAGLGLSHVGEFAFVLMLVGVESGTISDEDYSSVVTLAILSLIVTPMLLQTGLRYAGGDPEESAAADDGDHEPDHAVVIGLGPIGRQVASQLETLGRHVALVDNSPLNLHSFASVGFATAVGDATDPAVLRHAGVPTADVVVVCIPDDAAAIGAVTAIRRLNRRCRITVRCRYQSNIAKIQRAGATQVVSEEAEVSTVLLRLLR